MLIGLLIVFLGVGEFIFAQVNPPRSLSAKWNCETYGGVKLTWDYPEGMVKSRFEIICDGDILAITDENEISYVHKKPTGGTHKYEVKTLSNFVMSEPVSVEVSGEACCVEPSPVPIKDMVGLDGEVSIMLEDYDLYSVYYSADAPITDKSDHKHFFGDSITIENLVNDRIYHFVVFKIASDGKSICNFLMSGDVINPRKMED